MDDNSFYGAPAGWYPDPLGLPQLRWWDSTAWTHQVAEARAPMVMQETTYAWPEDELDDELADEQELPTRREKREQERRDHVDAPKPTALTLLELEPPSVAAIQEPAALVHEPAQATQLPLPDLLEPEINDPVKDRFAPTIAADFTARVAAAPDTVAPDTEAPDAPIAEGSFSVAVAPTEAPSESAPTLDTPVTTTATPDAHETELPVAQESADSTQWAPIPAAYETRSAPQTSEPEFPSPLSATRAASLQDNPQAPASEAPFDWSPQAEPAQAEAPRSRFVQQHAPEPIIITVPHKGTHNLAVWMIALIPLAQLVISLLILTAIGSAVSSTIMAAIWLAPYPLVIGLAAIDRAQLKRTGHENTAHWLWAFLTAPIYLIVRAVATIRESGGGFGPVLVWVVLGLLHIASIVAVPGLLISSLPTVFATQAEQSIVSDAAVIGAELEVTCPTPAVLIDQSFTCTGTTSTGKSLDIEVSLQRVNGWIDWRVDDWGIYTLG